MNKEVYKTYKCETCEKWFMYKDELNIHTTSVHESNAERDLMTEAAVNSIPQF